METAGAVLIVDDDSPSRAMLSLSLRRAGFEVRSASSGREALSILLREPLAAMITDTRMTPMDGFELARRAKVLRPGLRVAMMSAFYDEDDAAPLPVESFFQKPVAVDRVIEWLH